MKNGVSGAPVCVYCYGEHLVLAPKEPASLVNASQNLVQDALQWWTFMACL
jgi:hypothetical protein